MVASRAALLELLAPYEYTEDDLGTLTVGRADIPFFVVNGDDIGAFWEHCRSHSTTTGYWPVCLGARASLQRIGESDRDVSVESILRRAAEADAIDPSWLGSPSAADVPDPLPDLTPFSGVTTPFDAEASDGGVTYRPLDEAVLAFVPTALPWEVPAYLQFGGFNACPEPHQHVALLRHWHETYAAVVLGMTHDTIELVVERPPTDRDGAIRLANAQMAYSEELDMYSLATAAARLRGARVWHFWWD